jgi:hypothetical protein
METLTLILAGGLGALTKDIVKDNKLTLPCYSEGSVVLGCIGGIIIGAAVGFLVDNNPETAFFAGYAGSQMLTALVPKNGRK